MSSLDDIKFITKGNHDDKESKKLLVDFSIHNSDWALAREKIKGLIKFNPDREICEFMAAIEMGEFNDIQKRDSWMLRSENANLMNGGKSPLSLIAFKIRFNDSVESLFILILLIS